MRSGSPSYMISLISIIVLQGLTAQDLQKLKTLDRDTGPDREAKSKLDILGS